MIVFKKLRYKNILSTGNHFIEFDFLGSKSTVIMGTNGVGKSTLIDALIYVLYGDTFRDIKKLDQLINSINQKGLLVEVEFSIGTIEYLVHRGMKPNKFEIHINGEKRKSEGAVSDQKYLEDVILKLNKKAFTQIVVLSKTNYIPFMKLKTDDRRKIVENFFDIQLFTAMNQLHKSDNSANEEKISDNQNKIRSIDEQIRLETKHIDAIRLNNEKVIKDKQVRLTQHENRLTWLNDELDANRKELTLLLGMISKQSELEETKNQLELHRVNHTKRISSIKKQLEFYEQNDTCPTCKQNIDDTHKHTFKESALEKNTKSTEVLEQVSEMYLKVNKKLQKIYDVNTAITETNRTISKLNQDISYTNQYIKDLMEEIEEISKRTDDVSESLLNKEELERTKETLLLEYDQLMRVKGIYAASAVLLKDSGIKSRIVKQYIPVMNQIINQYLTQMDLFVDFNLDENFEETIRSRHRDHFSHGSFSEGEKMRIDLAIMFTWRNIAKKRNRASTNILIMDEIFDSSLDEQGIDELYRIVMELTSDTNIVIISPKHISAERFDSVRRIEKVANFSKVIE